MQKKVLIIVNNFGMGGTIASLYTLLSKIDPRKVHVDIFPRVNSGTFVGNMPNCTILSENLWLSRSIYNKSFITRILNFIFLVFRKLFEKIGVDLYQIYNKIGGRQIHTEDYDAVIGFDESLPRFISTLPARKRINWIHCDYRRSANGKDESRYYDKIDIVVCVSEFAKRVFTEYYPKYINKTIAIHNIINVEDLRQKASMPVDDSRFTTGCFNIVSCGRLDPVKQFHLIPFIADEIRKKTDKPFRWYIIGGGSNEIEKQIQQEIEKYDVSEYVIPLGMKRNPFKFMQKSNLYVCTSYSESYPMVVNEAKALGIPVLCNTFPSAAESIENGVNGYICEIELMPKIIALMIDTPMKIKKQNIENEEIINKFYELF